MGLGDDGQRTRARVRRDPLRDHAPGQGVRPRRLGDRCCEGQTGVQAPTSRPGGSRCSRRCSCTAACCTWRQHAVPVDLREQHRGLDEPRPLRVFYLLGGLVALGAQVVVDPNSAVPTVGASGAIAAVLGRLRAALSARAGDHVVFIIIFFTIIELPALLVLGIWILMQLWLGAASRAGDVAAAAGWPTSRTSAASVRAARDQAVRQSRAGGLRARRTACRSTDGRAPPFWPGRW